MTTTLPSAKLIPRLHLAHRRSPSLGLRRSPLPVACARAQPRPQSGLRLRAPRPVPGSSPPPPSRPSAADRDLPSRDRPLPMPTLPEETPDREPRPEPEPAQDSQPPARPARASAIVRDYRQAHSSGFAAVGLQAPVVPRGVQAAAASPEHAAMATGLPTPNSSLSPARAFSALSSPSLPADGPFLLKSFSMSSATKTGLSPASRPASLLAATAKLRGLTSRRSTRPPPA